MISPEIAKKIQEIKIRTRRVMNGALVGGYVTKRKGSGFEFDQIRAYEYGDDIRFVDWNSSARSGKLLVRQYLDEKNRTIMICLDVSASTFFGSQNYIKSDIMQQVSAVIALVADYEQDNVGLILFSDVIEKIIPPSRGHKHVMQIMETIFSYTPQQKKTDFNILFIYLVESFRREAAVFVISDFIADDFEQNLKRVVCQREVIAIRCLDNVERYIPTAGYVWGQDPETQAMTLLHLSKAGAMNLQDVLNDRLKKQSDLLRQNRVDIMDLKADENFIQTLVLYFKQRMMQK